MREEKRIENERKLNALRGLTEEENIEQTNEEQPKKRYKIFIAIILIIICLFSYISLISTKLVEVHEYKIESSKLPKSFNGLKVVHFSDIHYGTAINEKELSNIVTKINELKPDIVFFTGDLLNANINSDDKTIAIITKNLKKINATLYKYAIIGNDDKKDSYLKIMQDSDFIILNNEAKLLYYHEQTPIMIAGFTNNKDTNYQILNNNIENIDPQNLYKIVLTHEPDSIDKFINSYPDLILAGHTLGGVIKIPFLKPLFLEQGAQKYYKNYYKINNSEIYISNGLGTSNIDARFNNRPSLNFYRFYSNKKWYDSVFHSKNNSYIIFLFKILLNTFYISIS